jgi:hypothetical protein
MRLFETKVKDLGFFRVEGCVETANGVNVVEGAPRQRKTRGHQLGCYYVKHHLNLNCVATGLLDHAVIRVLLERRPLAVGTNERSSLYCVEFMRTPVSAPFSIHACWGSSCLSRRKLSAALNVPVRGDVGTVACVRGDQGGICMGSTFSGQSFLQKSAASWKSNLCSSAVVAQMSPTFSVPLR